MASSIDAIGSQTVSQGLSMPPEELSAEFANVLQSLQDKFGASTGDAGAGLDKQVQSFIAAADAGDDNKLSAAELSAALNISPQQAQSFVDTFNQTGDSDMALDSKELTSAVAALQAATNPQQSEAPSSGGKESKGGEQTAEAGGGKPAGAEQAGGGGAGGASDLLQLLTQLLDKDGDGEISPEEMKDFVEKYDKNGDGKLDKTELTEGIKAEAEAKGMGEISESDVDALLTQADEDGDGGLSAEELSTAISESAAQEK